MSDDDDPPGEPLMIECSIHGTTLSAVVCGHLVRELRHPTGAILGFIENKADPNDSQAWCGACERMFLREQALTEAFRAFNDMTMVCVGCYARIKGLHAAPS